MTQANETNSRLDRIESIMLDLAAAGVRHDNEVSRINRTLAQLAEQQKEADTRYEKRFENVNAQVEANGEQIATLTASIQELRNLVSDYIQGRENL